MSTRPLSVALAATAALAGALVAPAVAGAQLPNASTAAFGMAGNFLAAATGADAPAWNPAALGRPDAPGYAVRAFVGGGLSGLDPISWRDLSGWDARPVPRDVRQGWLDRVATAGGQTGTADGGLTVLALGVKRVAFQVGVAGYATADLAPDAVEAFLFGNAGRTGTPRDLRLAGSRLRGGAFGTAALSYGFPVGRGAALGVTAKYVHGGGVLRAEDAGSRVTASNIAIAFPTVLPREGAANAGRGLGLDVGGTWRAGGLALAAKVENVVNTFAWREDALRYRPGTASFDGTTSRSSFDERPYAEAPQALRDAIADERFAPTATVGAAWSAGRALLVTADARRQLGGDETILVGPRSHLGVGVETRALRILPLRAGAALVTGGWQVAAGAGLRLGPYELGAAYMLRDTDVGGAAPGFMLSLVSVR